MLLGKEDIRDNFKRLVKEGGLSHGYIFFGEPQVGKYSFALSLASFVEKGKFEKVETERGFPKSLLEETLIIKPADGSIGIDAVREIRHFLSQRPVKSDFRVVVIDDAGALTPQAQHAILKVTEEPPEASLIILIADSLDALMATLRSRLQKIHFIRSRTGEISEMLKNDYGLDKKTADEIALYSLGRPGRAVALATTDEAKAKFKTALALISKKTAKKKVIDELLENPDDVYPLLTELVAKLAIDPVKNYDSLRAITDRMTAMSQFSTNRRLQLETALWNI